MLSKIIGSVSKKPKCDQSNSDTRGKPIVLSEAVVPVKCRTFGDLQGQRKDLVVELV